MDAVSDDSAVEDALSVSMENPFLPSHCKVSYAPVRQKAIDLSSKARLYYVGVCEKKASEMRAFLSPASVPGSFPMRRQLSDGKEVVRVS